MTDESLTFQSLKIQRMHGFRPPHAGLHVDELSQGINVIHGPNASGKSTLARAVHHLIWPDDIDATDVDITGSFGMDSADWTIRIDAGHVTRRSDGADASNHALPPEDHSDRYHLYLHELLQTTNEDFARTILAEARGGYDVAKAARQSGFVDKDIRKGQTTKRVKKKEKKVETAEAQKKELKKEEDQLAELRNELDDAREAESKVSLVKQAITYAKSRNELSEAKRQLDDFPEVMEEVEGDESEDLKDLQNRISKAKQRKQDAQKEIRKTEAALQKNVIPEQGLPDGLLDEVSDRVENLKGIERKIEGAEEDLQAARNQATREWNRIQGTVDQQAAASLDVSDVGDLADLVKKFEDIRAKRKYLKHIKRLFGGSEAPEQPSPRELRDGIRQLQRWLTAKPDETDPSRSKGTVLWLIVSAGVSFVIVTTILAATIHLAWLTLLLLAAVPFIAAYLLSQRDNTDKTDRDADRYRREFEKLALPEPDSWDEAFVEKYVDSLTDRWAESKLKAIKSDEWESHEDEMGEVESDFEELVDKRDGFAASLGVAPEAGESQLHVFVERLRQWQDARSEVSRCERVLECKQERRDDLLAKLGEKVGSFGFGEPTDSSQASGQLESLKDALEAHRETRQNLTGARKELQKANSELDDARSERDKLFRTLKLEPGDEAKLHELCSNHEKFEEAEDEVDHAKRAAEREQEKVERMEDFYEGLLEKSIDELENRLEALEREAGKVDDIREKVTAIETRIEDAKKSHDIENARAEYREALVELEKERRDDYERIAGYQLAEFLRTQTRDAQLPRVFERARELFAEITRGRYRLELGDGDEPEFRAWDEVLEREFELNTLSSGTRVQLLLAVRIAFLNTQEDGCRLPLVLDETLANSDDERARAIIEAIETIARKRQVFYLTAQKDEVAQWHEYLDSTDVSHRILRLGDTDEDGGQASAWTEDLPEIVPSYVGSVTEPVDSMSHAEYGSELDVPDWTPRMSLGAIHLWYLIEDNRQLFRTLDAGVTQWGQLRGLAEYESLSAIDLSPRKFQVFRARATALNAFAEGWRVGRGKRVDRQALKDSGAVSDTFIDRVAELSKQFDGDASVIVGALRNGEVDRFRTNKTEELKEYFLEQGYMDETDSLTKERLWQRVLTAASGDIEKGIVDVDDLARLFERVSGVRPPHEVSADEEATAETSV